MFQDDSIPVDVASDDDGDDSVHFDDVPLTEEEKAEIAASATGLLEEE